MDIWEMQETELIGAPWIRMSRAENAHTINTVNDLEDKRQTGRGDPRHFDLLRMDWITFLLHGVSTIDLFSKPAPCSRTGTSNFPVGAEHLD